MGTFNKLTNKRVIDLPIEKRLQAYNKCLKFKKNNYKIIEIWEKLKQDGFEIKYETIRSWIRGTRKPDNRLNIIKKSDEKLPYLIGIILGDGCFYKVIKNGSYTQGRIILGVKEKELAEYFSHISAYILGKKTGHKVRWSKHQNVYIVEFCSKELVELLSKPLTKLDNSIKISPKNFIKGIYDAEGCISIKSQNNRLYPRIFLTNSNLKLINYIKRLLEKYDITSTIQKNTIPGKIKVINHRETATRKICYNLCIENIQGVRNFLKLISFTIKRKQDKLENIINLINKYGTKGAFQRWEK